jgi:hypothetical protein
MAGRAKTRRRAPRSKNRKEKSKKATHPRMPGGRPMKAAQPKNYAADFMVRVVT